VPPSACAGALRPHLCCAPLAAALCSLAHPCMHESPPPSILFVGGNSGIGMEGWAAVGLALSTKRNLKKLYLGDQRGNESSIELANSRILLFPLYFNLTFFFLFILFTVSSVFTLT
jgi:hypothetical protein